MVNLKDKVAFVTGGARDIGRQISIRLAEQGASVCVNYFDNPDEANETVKQITSNGGKAIAVQGDMTKPEDVSKAVKVCIENFGAKIDILANVAGGLVGRKTMDEM
ncbi:MAG: SDR family NAD(P)-dependent oxidoreductase, partial [Ignavibacteria bacterium]|nr:SDR family NAD(P)-dependent oxidoreductase [Ignavibacteria bacterium]